MPDYDVHATVVVRAPDEDAAINRVAQMLRGPVSAMVNAMTGDEEPAPDYPIYVIATFNVDERTEPPKGWTDEKPCMPESGDPRGEDH